MESLLLLFAVCAFSHVQHRDANRIFTRIVIPAHECIECGAGTVTVRLLPLFALSFRLFLSCLSPYSFKISSHSHRVRLRETPHTHRRLSVLSLSLSPLSRSCLEQGRSFVPSIVCVVPCRSTHTAFVRSSSRSGTERLPSSLSQWFRIQPLDQHRCSPCLTSTPPRSPPARPLGQRHCVLQSSWCASMSQGCQDTNCNPMSTVSRES